jgi:hypothetical protein
MSKESKRSVAPARCRQPRSASRFLPWLRVLPRRQRPAPRRLLAYEAGHTDAIEQTRGEIEAAGGCTGCILRATQAIALCWLQERFTTPAPPGSMAAGIVDINAVIAHIEGELAGGLDRIDYVQEHDL